MPNGYHRIYINAVVMLEARVHSRRAVGRCGNGGLFVMR